MKVPNEGEPPLTPEQRAVLDQPVDALLVVTAGAGAGKTHTIIRRVERLLAEDLSAQDVLVLTFSRSAMRQLRDRIARTGAGGHLVRVQTFDSWALDLLLEVDAHKDWLSRSFDERIRGATAAIADGLADDRYEELRHVVVDEVQDLVGDRRVLVQTLLDRFNCGFTIVGDPAQSIYGFQVADSSERSREAGKFIDWLRTNFDGDLIELILTENFRARTAEARTALRFGPELRRAVEVRTSDAVASRYEALRTVLMDTLILGDLEDEFVRNSLKVIGETGAILCRTNGQALLVSELLHEGEVPHRLQREAQDRVVPAWMGMLFDQHRGGVLTRKAFDDLAPGLPLPKEDRPSALWNLLMRAAAGSGHRSLDLGRLRRAVAIGQLPDELTAQPPTDLIISSFHRAKGLEFDRVIVMDPGPIQREGDTDVAEETRLLYVAMTRARDELIRLATANTWNVRVDDRTNRWARYGQKTWQRMGMEIVRSDVHLHDPAGMAEFCADAVDLQHCLASTVSSGDPIVLERLYEDSLEDGLSPPYLVVHACGPIGIVSASFREALCRLLKQNARFVPRRFPRIIERIRIDAVETVAGSEAAGALAGLGEHGVWLAPRLVGLGRFTYDKLKDGDG